MVAHLLKERQSSSHPPRRRQSASHPQQQRQQKQKGQQVQWLHQWKNGPEQDRHRQHRQCQRGPGRPEQPDQVLSQAQLHDPAVKLSKSRQNWLKSCGLRPVSGSGGARGWVGRVVFSPTGLGGRVPIFPRGAGIPFVGTRPTPHSGCTLQGRVCLSAPRHPTQTVIRCPGSGPLQQGLVSLAVG